MLCVRRDLFKAFSSPVAPDRSYGRKQRTGPDQREKHRTGPTEEITRPGPDRTNRQNYWTGPDQRTKHRTELDWTFDLWCGVRSGALFGPARILEHVLTAAPGFALVPCMVFFSIPKVNKPRDTSAYGTQDVPLSCDGIATG